MHRSQEPTVFKEQPSADSTLAGEWQVAQPGGDVVRAKWFALKIGPSTFGIFDAFPNEAGREAHLSGPIAAALMAKGDELLAQAPTIERVEILAEKL
jgi:hypothetical protein